MITHFTHSARTILLAFLLMSAPAYAAFAQGTTTPLDSNFPDQQILPAKPATSQLGVTDVSAEQKTPLIALAGQRLISYLNNLRSAIERNTSLDATEKAKIVTSINENISFIQTQTISVNNARTESDLQQRVTAIRNFWQQKQNAVTYYLGLITGGKFKRTIERFRSIETKFATAFSRFEPNEETKKLNEQFSAELQKADEEYTKARDAFAQIQSPGDHKAEFQAGLEAFRQAHLHLKEARRISRELISRIRESLGTRAPAQTSTPPLQP